VRATIRLLTVNAAYACTLGEKAMSLHSFLYRPASPNALPRGKRRSRWSRPALEVLEDRRLLSAFMVVNTGDNNGVNPSPDAGTGTLRQAIVDANFSDGPQLIQFQIPGKHLQTISLAGPLPLITDTLLIDGTSQDGYAPGQPVIDLDGSQAGGGNGLVFLAGGNFVAGLVINNFRGDPSGGNGFGIVLDGTNDHTGGSVIIKNFIGTDSTGTQEEGNNGGILIHSSSHNRIGGLNSGGNLLSGNLISGNKTTGIFIDDQAATDNHIEGNFIGTDVFGLKTTGKSLGNGTDGVFVGPPAGASGFGFPSGNFISDFDVPSKAINVDARNVISGNKHNGVYILGGSLNQVQGNYIGLGVDGVTPVPNSEDGVRIEDASLNTVGGTLDGSRNIISANTGDGVEILGSDQSENLVAMSQSATNNLVEGNFIGTDATGTFSDPDKMPNSGDELGNANGIEIRDQSTNAAVVVSFNVIGGADASDGAADGIVKARNIISGNLQNGILMVGARDVSNVVEGDFIGTDITGENAVPNTITGINLDSLTDQTVGPSGNLIGGTDAGAANVISGNGIPKSHVGDGVLIANGSNANFVQGNRIGTNASGLKQLGNVDDGVVIENSAGNFIGGAADGDTNIISGNLTDGVEIDGSDAKNNVVQRNRIGLAMDSSKLGNRIGVLLTQVAGNGTPSANLIGGTQGVGDQEVSLGNIISGNTLFGVDISSGANRNQVVGNFIGTDLLGTMGLGNRNQGVAIDNSPFNIIGGTTAAGRNIIVNNGIGVTDNDGGVVITGQASMGNVVQGNNIGVGSDGVSPLPNNGDGVLIVNATLNTIGGGVLRNIISGNSLNGVNIQGAQATFNVVVGNYIGTTADGSAAQPNTNGVLITNGAALNTIGGPGDSGRNVISGNNNDGVFILSAGAGNVLQNNYVGLNAQGTRSLKNTRDGIFINNTPSTIIGGDGSGNVIAGQANGDGIDLGGALTTDTQIKGNLIGTDKDAGASLGNKVGITVGLTASGSASQTIISANVIAGNLTAGILLDNGTHDNHIENDFIGTNSAGITTIPNFGFGIFISQSKNNFIGGSTTGTGNVIDFTGTDPGADPAVGSGDGILIAESTQTHVTFNAIVSNARDGIRIAQAASNNSIGGTTAQGNVIVNNVDGVFITGQATDNNVVAGNRIGIDGSGNASGNQGFGVAIESGASANTIGGATKNAQNIISANTGDGVFIGSQANGNTVAGNDIGTDANGSLQAGFGNGVNGIDIISAQLNFIGGETDAVGQAPGNTIMGNGAGVIISQADAEANNVQGNVIADSVGTEDTNGYGVEISNNSSNNHIGGDKETDANSIHDNAAAGVFIQSGAFNPVLSNQIFHNAGLGIDLAPEGVRNPNQPRKATNTGPNNLQNYPVLSIVTTGGSNRVVGTLESAANTMYTIQFFAGTASLNQDNAETLVLSIPVLTNASGVALIGVTLPVPLGAGTFVTATATDPNNNTSEFSDPVVETDTDGDGIPDAMEDAGPKNGDGNQDQIPDSQQTQVVTFPDSVNDGNYLTLVAPVGKTFQNVSFRDNPSPDDSPNHVVFNFGFSGFGLSGLTPGEHVAIEMILPVTTSAPLYYYLYGKTADNPSPHWFDWLYDKQTDTGAEIHGNIITLHFVDGGRGDDDLTANGTIVSLSAPGFADPFTVTNTADSADGSLRQAILNANANPGMDTITFDVQGPGPLSIHLLSALPAITDSVIIDGTTQPGYNGTPVIELDGSQAGTGVDGLTLDAADSTIQGLVINRFSGDGIRMGPAGNELFGDNIIASDYIGTDFTGTMALGNGSFGLEIDNSSDNSIGNSADNGRNIISANAAGGIFIHGSAGADNLLIANLIGTQADGVSPLGNGGPGVLLDAGTDDNGIGSGSPDQGNIIAFNAGVGVEVLQAQNTLIQANSIFANGGLGIDLGGDGVTANDPNDSDGLQNYPVLTHVASYDGRNYLITGTLSSAPDSSFSVEFYASASADASGFGEGQTFLGSTTVNTDASGQAAFNLSLETSVAGGSFVTATATNADTSEFSAALQVPASGILTFTVNTTDDVNDAVPDPAHFSLREAILAANSHPGADIIRFDLPNLDRTISPLSPLPDITDPVTIDGTSQPGYQGLPLVELDGSLAGPGADGLRITGGGSIVRGLVVHGFRQDPVNGGFGGNEITLQSGGGNLIEGNFLGTDVTGTSGQPNQLAGLFIHDSPDNVIGGTTAQARNVILNILLIGSNATGNRVEGNYIDTDVTGTALLMSSRGLDIEAPANTIGGLEAGAGNVIAGGVSIFGGNSNVVQGNLIGTDFTGTVFLTGELQIGSGGSHNLIGGTTAAARNILAGGVFIASNANQVQGNYIGTDITGTVALHGKEPVVGDPSGGGNGVIITGLANTIGGDTPGAGNLISGNPASGVYLFTSAANNSLEGNRIGTDVTGTKPLGNSFDGVRCTGRFNFIGGFAPGAGNLISGNVEDGLAMEGSGGNLIEGNFIGTDATGTRALGNGIVFTGFDGVYVSEMNDRIGGFSPGDGNVISGNGGNGIYIDRFEGPSSGTVIQSNFIGTDVTGMLRLGNSGDGILIHSSPNNLVGGTTPRAGNVISANGGNGVSIIDYSDDVNENMSSIGNTMEGNKIGTDVTGTGNLGNAGDGVSFITSGYIATNDIVGGTDPGAGNVIAYNGGPGVSALFGTGDAIRGNAIFANAGLGIVSDINGVLSTYAEARSLNLLSNLLVLTSAVFDPQGTVLEGTLTGTPFTSYDLDFFANDASDPNGFGQGQTFLESITVRTDETGSAPFRDRLELAVPVGQWITATATDPAGNTSQFSQELPVVAAIDANTVQFSAPAYLVTENGVAAVVVVTRTGSSAGTVTVDYATADGSAKAGTDYTAQSGTFVFADGEVSQTLTIPIQADTLAQVDESFSVVLSNPSGVSLGSVPEAVVTIADSDAAGQVAFSSSALTTLESFPLSFILVTRTGGSRGRITVDYRVTGGTATPEVGSDSTNFDYEDFFGTLVFEDGQTTANLPVQIFDDFPNPVYEGPETIAVTLGNPTGGAKLGAVTNSVLTITDDDDLAGGFGDVQLGNAIEGSGPVEIEVFRTGLTTTTESVDYATLDGTAAAGVNYEAVMGTLTFKPGELEKFIEVPILDDMRVGDPGTFQVVLSNPTGGAILDAGRDQVNVQIEDSDSPGRFVVVASEFHENGGNALIEVDRLGGSRGAVQVDYATSDGTATAGADYTAASGTLTFKEGETSKIISVPILPDNLVEGDETFFVALSNPTGGATIDAANPAVETIYETPGLFQLSAANYVVAESNAGFTVTVIFTALPEPSGRSPGTTTVDFSTHDGTATAGADYTAVSGKLTFTNSGRQTFTIPILNDSLVENNETILLTLSNATGGPGIGAKGNATLTILDEDSARPAATTTTVSSDQPDGSTYGQLDTFTATVGAESGTPTGSVQFQIDGADFGSPIALSGGEASITTTGLHAGPHSVVAFYTSDSNDFIGSDNTQNPLTQTVNSASLTVTADNESMTYGDSLPTLTATFTGLVSGDTSATFNVSPNVPPTLSTVPATSHSGSYAITISGAADPDYTILFVDGTLTISPAPLTISANNQTMVQGGNPPTLTASFTGLVNGDTPATFNLSPNVPPTLSTVPANSPAGSYAITIGGASDADYAITYVNGNLIINNPETSPGVTLRGTVFFDYNSNGVLDSGEPGLADRTVFLDLKNSGQFDTGDPSTVTATDGSFRFIGLTPGSYLVREQVIYDNVALTSSTSRVINASADVSGINFGNVPFNPAFPVYPSADLFAAHANADATTSYVSGLYLAVLGRNADPNGLSFWVNALKAGMPTSEAAYLFVNSLEHRQEEVNYYYKSFLGRDSDPGSIIWVNQLVNGGNEAKVIEGILSSQEYTAKHASNAAFITDLYFHLLGRQADSAGQTFWEEELSSGVSRAAAVAAFLNSQESAELASESFYAAFLHRAKDQPGDDHWVGLLTSQSQTFGQVASAFFSVAPFEFQESEGRSVP
jgi:CSLREA domain-containing protein